jgi:hypothetical protein
VGIFIVIKLRLPVFPRQIKVDKSFANSQWKFMTPHEYIQRLGNNATKPIGCRIGPESARQ